MTVRKNTAKDLWQPKRRIELSYQRSLKLIMKRLEKKLNGLTSLKNIIREIKKFTNSYEFKKYADATAMKMVTHLFTDAGHTWREAAKENSKGKIIYESLKKELNGPVGFSLNEHIQRNAELIKSMPLDIGRSMTGYVMEESLKGKRHTDIAKELMNLFPQKNGLNSLYY